MNNPATTIDQVTYFAETNFRNRRVKFGIRDDDRRRHMYLIGKTGMGKSVCLENMIISDIVAGNGVAVVDPHGDTVEKVVKHVPANRINDVIYFNPSDTEYPIAFNILEEVNPQYKNLVAQGLTGVFKKIWADSWGPRLEYILMNTILALLEYPGSTLLGITRMLVDKNYRRKVVTKLTDPIVKAFWLDEYANYNERFRTEAISPIQNKVGQFLSSSIIRNIVGQPKSTIDMRKIMDEKKILLLNLSKGRIGEENSALLGAMMITKIQLAAMSRVDIPEEERKDFYLYVDEFQNFSTESFANILSEARKYRLNLIVAHQYIEQLGDEVKAAVFGNVGTIVCFRVGAEDAEFLEKEFMPYFDQNDLVNLPKYNVYLKLMIDGVSSNPFSATTLPPAVGETGNYEKIVNVSRERYANTKESVEEKIIRWSGVEEMYRATAEEDARYENGEQRARPKTQVRPEYKKPEVAASKPPAAKSVVRIVKDNNDNSVKPAPESPPPAISLQEALKNEPVSFGKSFSRKVPPDPRENGNHDNHTHKNRDHRENSANKHIIRPGQVIKI
ncbi:MAG: hypothetical protein COY66_06345 [Candidatus Kerfeldbacteria bacterium CG_4_10_14_0_8_um_filter_42_10]|uniref:Type IV secretion system coupling protein TraD DNA-binding domain-containing protein n=1 Tax=Candidatus Kerfeldbacteria bacterium CG_4_10_14_0_8_um_filter_42_10 TaxID=2014248 RepID=A0A2M7RGE5_9BACT|nr:MAG: hypothetical protein COY66_06345 [Candidatus Kerfeldbacteria bacterium CG_4_10_14_0_8_um_filter_42_10]